MGLTPRLIMIGCASAGSVALFSQHLWVSLLLGAVSCALSWGLDISIEEEPPEQGD